MFAAFAVRFVGFAVGSWTMMGFSRCFRRASSLTNCWRTDGRTPADAHIAFSASLACTRTAGFSSRTRNRCRSDPSSLSLGHAGKAKGMMCPVSRRRGVRRARARIGGQPAAQPRSQDSRMISKVMDTVRNDSTSYNVLVYYYYFIFASQHDPLALERRVLVFDYPWRKPLPNASFLVLFGGRRQRDCKTKPSLQTRERVGPRHCPSRRALRAAQADTAATTDLCSASLCMLGRLQSMSSPLAQ